MPSECTLFWRDGTGGTGGSAPQRRMDEAAVSKQGFEEAASLRDLLHTGTKEDGTENKDDIRRRQNNTDFYAFYAERGVASTCSTSATAGSSIAASSSGKTRSSSIPAELFSSLIKQIYPGAAVCYHVIHGVVDFENSEPLEEVLSEKRRRGVRNPHAAARPEEGHARSIVTNAKHQLRPALSHP